MMRDDVMREEEAACDHASRNTPFLKRVQPVDQISPHGFISEAPKNQNGQTPDGTKKPDLPPGLADDESEASEDEETPGTKKPDLPPGLSGNDEGVEADADGEPGTKKPDLPPGLSAGNGEKSDTGT